MCWADAATKRPSTVHNHGIRGTCTPSHWVIGSMTPVCRPIYQQDSWNLSGRPLGSRIDSTFPPAHGIHGTYLSPGVLGNRIHGTYLSSRQEVKDPQHLNTGPQVVGYTVPLRRPIGQQDPRLSTVPLRSPPAPLDPLHLPISRPIGQQDPRYLSAGPMGSTAPTYPPAHWVAGSTVPFRRPMGSTAPTYPPAHWVAGSTVPFRRPMGSTAPIYHPTHCVIGSLFLWIRLCCPELKATDMQTPLHISPAHPMVRGK